MATLVLKNAYLTLAAVNLSAWVKEVSITDETEALDESAMGDNTRKNKPGIYNPGWTIKFKQDYAAGGPDATYWASLRGQTFSAICNPNSSTTATDNPRFTQTVMVESYAPVEGAHGELAMTEMVLVPAGDLSRATS